MLGYPLTPRGTPAADRPTYLPPPPPSRPPKVFAPGWGLEIEQAAPLDEHQSFASHARHGMETRYSPSLVNGLFSTLCTYFDPHELAKYNNSGMKSTILGKPRVCSCSVL